MSTAARLAGFVAALVAVFGVAVLVGGRVGPVDEPAAAEHGTDHADAVPGAEWAGHGDHAATTSGAATTGDLPGGLQVSEGGYTLVLDRTTLPAGERTVSFRVEGPDGRPVRDYEVEHTKELHLIAVRRDLTGFQHVHPERAGDGTWSVPLDLTGGPWRLFADFTAAPADGAEPVPLTLGIDLAVTGPGGRPAGDGPDVRRVDRVDGYRVEMTGTLAAGEESDLRFAVTRDGKPVADLQPYLGARGHLVALREGDLAYLHVHPTDAADATGNEVGFAATVPSVGGYRLYLDFRVDDVLRSASFAMPTVGGGAPVDPRGGDTGHGEDDHAH